MTTSNEGEKRLIEQSKEGSIRIRTDLSPRVFLLPAVGAATGLSVGESLFSFLFLRKREEGNEFRRLTEN